jgi:hypothetical protein
MTQERVAGLEPATFSLGTGTSFATSSIPDNDLRRQSLPGCSARRSDGQEGGGMPALTVEALAEAALALPMEERIRLMSLIMQGTAKGPAPSVSPK